MNDVERFMSLFSGSDVAYGEWVQDRDPKALTRHGKPTAKQYEDHLNGSVGLGIVPVNTEGVSCFGALDIDIDSIDHAALYKTVASRGFPLNVCRSKSGGAHLYMFAPPPGLPSSLIRQVLSKFAILLGYPSVEVFPKQARSTEGNVGNWINLPYFGRDSTTRYCVNEAGSMTFTEFLRGVRFYDPAIPVTETRASSNGQLPPCLATLQEQGIAQGARNTVLFNFAVFYRKSEPDQWENKLKIQNSQFFTPPLSHQEVQGVISSASRGKYQYMCEQEPLRSFCNREVCAGLKFGVSHMPWQESGAFDELIVRNCRKLLSDPPMYMVEINGKDVTMSWENLSGFRKFKNEIGKYIDIVPKDRKQASWDLTIRELLANKTDIETPDDASFIGLVIDKLHEFLVTRERATEKEDLLRGLPIQEGDTVLFRAADFIRYLQGYKMDRGLDQPKLFLTLRNHGAEHRRVRLNGRLTQVWTYPVRLIHEQTQEFAVPDFKKDYIEEV